MVLGIYTHTCVSEQEIRVNTRTDGLMIYKIKCLFGYHRTFEVVSIISGIMTRRCIDCNKIIFQARKIG